MVILYHLNHMNIKTHLAFVLLRRVFMGCVGEDNLIDNKIFWSASAPSIWMLDLETFDLWRDLLFPANWDCEDLFILAR